MTGPDKIRHFRNSRRLRPPCRGRAGGRGKQGLCCQRSQGRPRPQNPAGAPAPPRTHRCYASSERAPALAASRPHAWPCGRRGLSGSAPEHPLPLQGEAETGDRPSSVQGAASGDHWAGGCWENPRGTQELSRRGRRWDGPTGTLSAPSLSEPWGPRAGTNGPSAQRGAARGLQSAGPEHPSPMGSGGNASSARAPGQPSSFLK